MGFAPDSFAGALVARLATLTPYQRRLVLAQALRLLAEAVPRLSGPQRLVVAAPVATALEQAGYIHEAQLVRWAVLRDEHAGVGT